MTSEFPHEPISDNPFLNASSEDLKKIQKEHEDAQRYIRASNSWLYPYAKFVRIHARSITALVAASALTGIFLISKPDDAPLSQPDTLSPTVTSSQTNETLTQSSSTQLDTTAIPPSPDYSPEPRDPNSTIKIRKSFSNFSYDEYTCEDLLQRLPRKISQCNADEQLVFDDHKDNLEGIANSPRFFAAFPVGHNPEDRVATSLGACIEFYNGIDVSSVATDINYWFPVNEFNAQQLSLLSLKNVCPEYAN